MLCFPEWIAYTISKRVGFLDRNLSMHESGPIRALPADYVEVYVMRAAHPRFWGPLVGLSLLALALSAALGYGLSFAYYALGAPLVIGGLPDSVSALAGLVLIVGVLPLHEWIHGLMMIGCGHRPRYGLTWYALYATADNAWFRRDEYLRILLAPLLVITVGSMVLVFFVPPAVGYWVILAMVVNATGAAGDLLMALIVRRAAAADLVQDERDGLRLFSLMPADRRS